MIQKRIDDNRQSFFSLMVTFIIKYVGSIHESTVGNIHIINVLFNLTLTLLPFRNELNFANKHLYFRLLREATLQLTQLCLIYFYYIFFIYFFFFSFLTFGFLVLLTQAKITPNTARPALIREKSIA